MRTVFCKRLFTAHFARTLDPRRFFASSPSCSSASAADATPPLTQHAQASPSASLCSGASGGFAQDRSGSAYHGFTQDRCRRLGYSTASAYDRSRASTTRRVHSHRLHVAGEYAVKIPPIQARRFSAPRILVGFRAVRLQVPSDTRWLPAIQ